MPPSTTIVSTGSEEGQQSQQVDKFELEKKLREAKVQFEKFVSHSSAYIEEEGIEKLLQTYHDESLSEAKVKKAIRKYKDEGDRRIDFADFCTLMPEISEPEQKCIDLYTYHFGNLDKDKNGILDKYEILEALGKSVSKEKVDAAIKEVDLFDGNGEVNLAEFIIFNLRD